MKDAVQQTVHISVQHIKLHFAPHRKAPVFIIKKERLIVGVCVCVCVYTVSLFCANSTQSINTLGG
jgi:hypothetical protein